MIHLQSTAPEPVLQAWPSPILDYCRKDKRQAYCCVGQISPGLEHHAANKSGHAWATLRSFMEGPGEIKTRCELSQHVPARFCLQAHHI